MMDVHYIRCKIQLTEIIMFIVAGSTHLLEYKSTINQYFIDFAMDNILAWKSGLDSPSLVDTNCTR